MHPQTIFAKTTKGVLEIRNKTIRLPRDLDLVFLAVDGKTAVAELPRRARIKESAFFPALERLVADGYVKVFCDAADAGQPTAVADDLDLDFTTPQALAQLRSESAARAKAEANARAEAALRAAGDAKARQNPETKARALAEAKARIEAEVKAGTDAEEEHRAREQVTEQIKAEVLRAREDAERKARAEAEAQARAEADQRAREEAERLQRETQLRVASEEAERKARAEAEAEQRAWEEAERLQCETELRVAREEAEAKTRAELKALEESIRKTREEARTREEAERKARAEVEAIIVEAKLKAREQPEVRKGDEAQQRAEAMAARRGFEAKQALTNDAAPVKAGEPVKWGRIATTTLLVLIAGALAVLQVMPFSGYIPGAEKALSERLQEPVTIGSLSLTLLPSPQVKLERIIIGKAQDVRIRSAMIPLTSLAVLEEQKDFDEVQLIAVDIDHDALPRLAGWAQPQSGKPRLQIHRLELSAVKLGLRGLDLPAFDATLTFGAEGKMQKAALHDSTASVELTDLNDQGMRVNFTARNWQPPVGPPLQFSWLSGSVVVGRQQALVSHIEGELYGGALHGSVTFDWKAGLSAKGELNLKDSNLRELLPVFTRDFSASGVLDAGAQFATRGKTPAELFVAPRVSATFTLHKGALDNVDLVNAIQSVPRGGLRGGKMLFDAISGEAQIANNRISYRNLKLSSGPLHASGALDVLPASALSGRIYAQLTSQNMAIARSTLNVGGSLKDPLLSQY